jgi:hypothetical protein
MNAVARRGIAVLLLGAILPFAAARAQVTSAAIEQAVFAGAVASPADFQQVLVVCNDTPVVANAGVALAPGCTVLPGATQVITTINRNEVEVTAEPGTQLDFLPDGIRVVLGQVFVKFRALDVRGWFRVETIHGIAEVRGTQFDVQVTPDITRFRLLEGALRVRAFDTDQQADIVPGQRADIVARRIVRTETMSGAEIRAIVERVRRTERILARVAGVPGSYVGLQVPEPMASATPRIESFAAIGTTLTWRVQDAARVEIVGLGRVPASGSREVRPASTTTYTLVATGADGRSVSDRATIQVANIPVIEHFAAVGNRLTWRVQNAARVEIVGLAVVAASGSREVRPASTTTYTLIATGADGRSVNSRATVQVATAPIIDEMRWTGKVLRWSVRNAIRISISGLGAVPASGSREVAPGSYTLTAYGDGGQRSSRTAVVPQPSIEQNPSGPSVIQPRRGIIDLIPGRSVE